MADINFDDLPDEPKKEVSSSSLGDISFDDLPDDEAKKPRRTLGHDMGVLARAVGTGIEAPEDMLTGAINAGKGAFAKLAINDALQKKGIPASTARRLAWHSDTSSGDVSMPSADLNADLDAAGVAGPDTPTQRIVSAGISGLTGGMAFGPEAALPSLLSAGASQGAKEEGAGPGLQTIAALAGAAVPGGARALAAPKQTATAVTEAVQKARNALLNALQRHQVSPMEVAQNIANGVQTGLPLAPIDFLTKEVNGEQVRLKNIDGIAKVGAQFQGPAADIAPDLATRTAHGPQVDRMGNSLDAALGTGNYDDTLKSISDRQKASAPLYEVSNATEIVPDEKTIEGLKNPNIKGAINRGLALQRDEHTGQYLRGEVKEPWKPEKYGAIENEDGTVSLKVPNMRALDAGKKGLDAMITDSIKDGKYTEQTRSLLELKNGYLQHLDELNPNYAAARAAYAGPAAEKNALTLGQNYRSMRPREIKTFMSGPGLSDGERQAFLTGAKDDMTSRMMSSKNPSKALDTELKTGHIQAMFPDEASFQKFKKSIDLNKRMFDTDSMTRGGSDTAAKLDAKEELTTTTSSPVLQAGRALTNTIFSPRRAVAKLALDMFDKGMQRDVRALDQDSAHELMKMLYHGDANTFMDLHDEAVRRGMSFNGGPSKKAPTWFDRVSDSFAKKVSGAGVPAIGAAVGADAAKSTPQNMSPPARVQPQSANSPTLMNKLGIISPAEASVPPEPIHPAFHDLPPSTQDAAIDLKRRIGKAESNGSSTAANPASSAYGKYQFTAPTWRSLVYKYGKETGVGLKDRTDAGAQEKMMPYLMRENAQTLTKNLKRPPTDGEIYAAHFLGAGRASHLIKTAKSAPDKLATEIIPEDVTKRNKNIFFDKEGNPRTVSEVYDILDQKVSGEG